jgi:putative integral membrane protein (TIGR02587 family)
MARGVSPVGRSLEEYGRGVAGGFIFAMPLLLTMEVWWAGFIASPARLLAGLAATFVLLLGYNEYAGLHDDHGFAEVVIDSVEELGLGLVIAFAALFLFGRIELTMAWTEIVGKTLVAGLVVAIGVSVGTAQLGGESRRQEDGRTPRRSILNIVVLSMCGAVLIAANVAPTEEILIVGAELAPQYLLVTMAASLTIAAVILFFSEFRGSHRLHTRQGRVVLGGCVVTYAIALTASAGILWFFGRFDDASLAVIVGQSVVLGFAATLGASAGRLLLQ